MKNDIVNKGILILIILLSFACKTRQKAAPVISTGPIIETKSAVTKSEILKQANSRQVIFNTLLIKAKADLNINDNKNEVNMNIRMQEGKAIWISVSVPIIGEVARTLITPDSIKIINKLQSSYTRKPFSYVHQYTSEQVNFRTLQDLLIGNATFGTLTQTSIIDVNAGHTVITGNLADLFYSLIFNENFNLTQNNLIDKGASQTLSVNYSEHRQVIDQQIPHTIVIKSEASNKSIDVDLRYNYVGLNETVDFPFSVSKRYTVKD